MPQRRFRCNVIVLAFCAALAVSTPLWAQESSSNVIGSDVRPRATDTTFWLVSGGLVGSMVIDTRSTFQAFQRCPSCREGNPFSRPFVEAGPAFAYTAGAVLDIGVMSVAARMKGSSNPVLRKIWWVAPIALTLGHIWAARHNMNQR